MRLMTADGHKKFYLNYMEREGVFVTLSCLHYRLFYAVRLIFYTGRLIFYAVRLRLITRSYILCRDAYMDNA